MLPAEVRARVAVWWVLKRLRGQHPGCDHGEHAGFPLGTEGVVFIPSQSISKIYFMERNHHMGMEQFFLPLPGFSYPKAAATRVPDKVPRDQGFTSQTSGHSPVTTEESEPSGLQFRSF